MDNTRDSSGRVFSTALQPDGAGLNLRVANLIDAVRLSGTNETTIFEL